MILFSVFIARVNSLQDYVPILQKAQKEGLKIALHFAEVPNDSEVTFILNHETFRPDRFGHCTCIHPSTGGKNELFQKFVELKIPSEICMTSNVSCNDTLSYETHHIKHFFEHDLPICICTDDKGAFKKSSSEEHAIAMQMLKANQDDMYNLSFKSIEYIFANEYIKDQLRSKFVEWKQSFTN